MKLIWTKNLATSLLGCLLVCRGLIPPTSSSDCNLSLLCVSLTTCHCIARHWADFAVLPTAGGVWDVALLLVVGSYPSSLL